MIHFRRALKPRDPKPLRIHRFERIALDSASGSALVDSSRHKAHIGCWMFYLPDFQAKLFHARDGNIDCTAPSRPTPDVLEQRGRELGRYQSDDWRAALTTSVTRRLAELWIVSSRLWRAGLGPEPLGLAFAGRFERDGEALGPTAGLRSANVYRLRRKLPCRVEHIEAAGVRPDRIMSCVRQQVRGYVIDLCSVVGCVPVDAEDEIARLEILFRAPVSDDTLQRELSLTPAA